MKNVKVISAVPPAQILLIDDNKHGLMARKTVLEEQGYAIVTANTPEDGLAQFGNTHFDVVVTDYRMPKMNGAEVIAEIRRQKPTMPIVLVSGLVDALGLNEQNTGADVVIAKSATEIPHLIRAVNRLSKKLTPKKPARSQSSAARVHTKSS
jgi:CheY-like chemotaxis protein